jgi:chromosome segregation ATPase
LTDSVSGGASGYKVKNYYTYEHFNCKYMTKISDDNNRSRYFSSFRDFSSYNANSDENSWYNMKHFEIWMGKPGKNYRNQFLSDKNLIYDDISGAELVTLIKQLNDNKNNYLSKFRNFKTKLSDKKIDAESKTAQKARNIATRAQLLEEVNNKQAEFAITQEAKREYTSKSEATKLKIRNFESEIATIRTTKFTPLVALLQAQTQQLSTIQQEIAGNQQKLEGIVPIDKNDYDAKKQELRKKLIELNSHYLMADPKHIAINDVLTHFEANQNLIPSVIA